MATATPEVVPSRNERKPETRYAVCVVLKSLDRQLVTEEEDANYNMIREIIEEEKLGPAWIDNKDIAHALQWLHAHGYVRCTHRNPRTDSKEHRIRVLLRHK